MKLQDISIGDILILGEQQVKVISLSLRKVNVSDGRFVLSVSPKDLSLPKGSKEKSFDVRLKVSFQDVYLVKAFTQSAAKEKLKKMLSDKSQKTANYLEEVFKIQREDNELEVEILEVQEL